MDITEKKVVGFEALIRWASDKGIVSNDFIYLAEKPVDCAYGEMGVKNSCLN